MAEQWSGMRGIADVPTYVVMQPTTLCNLDCSYCYLPFRSADRRMPVAVAAAVAGSVSSFAAAGRFSVVWHGGEPLATGRDHLAALIAPFDPAVEHHVQTNATLIDDAWCEFFAEHEVRVSVSVDGPEARNGERITLVRERWRVPESLPLGDATIVPLGAGEELRWRVAEERGEE